MRKTARKRVQAKLKEIKAALRYRWHHPVPEVGAWLASVIRGHMNYFAVPRNFEAAKDRTERVGFPSHRLFGPVLKAAPGEDNKRKHRAPGRRRTHSSPPPRPDALHGCHLPTNAKRN